MLNAKKKLALVGAAVTMWLGVNVAHADIIDQGYALLDTETGYEWLKMDATLGQSYDEVVGRVNSGDLQDWNVASLSDVDLLVTNFLGFGFESFPSNNSTTARDYEGANLLSLGRLIENFSIPAISNADPVVGGGEECVECPPPEGGTFVEEISYYLDGYVSDELSQNNAYYDPNTLMQEVVSMASYYNPNHLGVYSNLYPNLDGNAVAAEWISTFIFRDTTIQGTPFAGSLSSNFAFASGAPVGEVISTSQSANEPGVANVSAPLSLAALMGGLLMFGRRKTAK